MTSPLPFRDPAELAALYAVGALPAEEAAAFEALLRAGCEDCQREMRGLESVVDALTRFPTKEEPPQHVREDLLRRAEADQRAEGHSPGHQAGHQAGQPAQIWRAWAAAQQELNELFTLRSSEGEWSDTGVPGVEVRRLFVDAAANRMTAMFRMAPGTAYPRHIHDEAEECYVLQGDLHVGDIVLKAGDYQRAGAGSNHDVQWTEGGCLLFITCSMSDELV
jgi:quercetin dioxygenase-like cupin family protein